MLDSGRIEFLIGGVTAPIPGFMLKKGEVFGWAELLERTPTRIAGARCLEAPSVPRLNGKSVLRVLGATPPQVLVMRRLAALIAPYLASSGAR